MQYKKLVEVYDQLGSTTKRLEKTHIISKLLKNTPKDIIKEIIYLLQGNVFPPWDERKIGMSSMLVIKVIKSVTGTSESEIKKLWRKKGDLGEVAKELIKSNKQTTFFSRKLTVEKVVDNIRKLPELTGQGTVNRKIGLMSELLSNASPEEAKYIVKTILEELRLGIAEGTMRDSIVWAFYPKVVGIFFRCENCDKIMPAVKKCVSCGFDMKTKFKDEINKKYPDCLEINALEDLKKLDNYSFVKTKTESLAREAYNKFLDDVQSAYNLSNDMGVVAENLKSKGIASMKDVAMHVGVPINSMLAIRVETIKDALKALGTPVLVDFKLDGFRCQIHKENDKITLFTRRMENVTKQFSELLPLIESQIKGKSFIIDAEIVGYDPKTGKYKPFQDISQRIKRKYDIEKMAKDNPVELDIFDIIYYEGKNMLDSSQEERRNLLEKIIKPMDKRIVLTKGIISSKESEIAKFYESALKAGVEGVMIKKLEKSYTPGRKVGGWIKIKPTLEPLDLVITGATYGEGKRAHVLSSFILSCRAGSKFLKCGMVGTGIKEKEEQDGITFSQITKLLKPHIFKETGRLVDIKPKIVVEVGYEEIQKSPTYDSGYALRFPRFLRLRNLDKNPNQANSLADIDHIYREQNKLKSKRR